MPGGISLLKFLKRTPPTDTRNLIEPSADVRYLAMKVRSGQTKNIFDLLDLSDNKHVVMEPQGRFAAIGRTTPVGTPHGWLIFMLDNYGDETDIQAAIDFVPAAGVASILFPPGKWDCDNPITDNNRIVKLFGSGIELTDIVFTPNSPTNSPLFNSSKNYVHLESMSFYGDGNLTNNSLITLSGQHVMVERCFFGTSALAGDSQTCLSIAQDYSLVKGCAFSNPYRDLIFNGQNTKQWILDNEFSGTGYGIQLTGTSNPCSYVISRNFINAHHGIHVTTPVSLNGTLIESNIFNAGGTYINDNAKTGYLIHGNQFLGGGAFTVGAGIKARDNIGLADQN